MKNRTTLIIGALLFAGAHIYGQAKTELSKEDKAALEGVILEKYYVVTEEDIKDTTGGVLAKGSITYRIYIDLKPGYHLQAVFGITDHPFSIKTSTDFFNNKMGGVQSADQIVESRLNQNTVALDSWVTIAAATKTSYGILKTEDTDGSILTRKGLDKADGLIKGDRIQKLLYYGIDLGFFGEGRKGSIFYSDNGSWAVVGGGKGPTAENKVLIAQLTTNGKLSFELNVQVGAPDGKVIQFVAKKPGAGQILFKQLNYKQ